MKHPAPAQIGYHASPQQWRWGAEWTELLKRKCAGSQCLVRVVEQA